MPTGKPGGVVTDQPLYDSPEPLGRPEPGTAGFGGLAWLDDRAVRVATMIPPAGANRIYRYTEVLKLVDVAVR
ncbi:MAG: hypothetical protein HOV68_33800 [Streptomycetaceae bacterium]|nr:hypothetical protein [Streptomycetaceae bacterium]